MPGVNHNTQDKTQLRADLIQMARDYVSSGAFVQALAPLIAIPSESPREDSLKDQMRYLQTGIQPLLESIGFDCQILANRIMPRLPLLYAQRMEDETRPTVLMYGHGDVLWGMEGDWNDGRSPWKVDVVDGRIYGRGTVDNKGQHLINLTAVKLLIEKTGRLGFNLKILLETGEESGSAGLREAALDHKDRLRADVLIASDGPRMSESAPTVFLGARGGYNFDLVCHYRDGSHHSGNWGGLLVNPGIRLAHALATITDAHGKILIDAWRPAAIPAKVKNALRKLDFTRSAHEPHTDPAWGEPGLSAAEKVYGWCSFEVLAYTCGRPQAPVAAIPGRARASCQLRYVVDIDHDDILPALRRHLDQNGFQDIEITVQDHAFFKATRTDMEHPWVQFTLASIAQTTGKTPAVLPNLGGSLPNEVFLETLGLPTIWVPHSHPSCAQHAPNEHMLLALAEEGLAMMTGLFYDIAQRDGKPS